MSFSRDIVYLDDQFALTGEYQAITKKYYESMVLYYVKLFEFSLKMLERPWNDYLKKFIDYLLKNTKDKKVLFFGSGAGRDALMVSQHGFIPYLVDASQEMLAISKRVVINGKYYNEDMNAYLQRIVELNEEKFIGVLNESAAQHLNKTDVYRQVGLVKEVLQEGGIFLIGLKSAPDRYKEVGPIYSITEGEGTRYFVSWTQKEILELISFAKSIGLHVISIVDTPHLASNVGTPNFTRLFFSLSS